jgi:hypothetical protein
MMGLVIKCNVYAACSKAVCNVSPASGDALRNFLLSGGSPSVNVSAHFVRGLHLTHYIAAYFVVHGGDCGLGSCHGVID